MCMKGGVTYMWYEKQLRIFQTLLTEPDIICYDVHKVVRYLEEIQANCIVINAGGIVDFFKNKLELANPNRFMTYDLLFTHLPDECHKKGIKVIGRVDFRGVEQHVYSRQPDWFAKNKEGTPVISPIGLYSPCVSGVYWNEYAAQFIKQIFSSYDIDGIWENAVGVVAKVCYCESCRESYAKDLGKQIPEGANYDSKEFDEYRVWKASHTDRHLKLMHDTIKSFGDNKAYTGEIFGMYSSSRVKGTCIDMNSARKYFDFLVNNTYNLRKRGLSDLSQPITNTVFMKSIDREKQAVILFGNNGGTWRYVNDPKVETKIWIWQAVAAGAGLWDAIMNGQYPGNMHDNRNAFIAQDAFHYLARYDNILQTQLPVADVGIFFSTPTQMLRIESNDRKKRRSGENGTDNHFNEFIKGVERVMLDNHIQYAFYPDTGFSLEEIRKLKLLILPNVMCLSDEHISIIQEYVSEGGGLIATYETSLYDENGVKREDFGLKELFGCNYSGSKGNYIEGDSYQMIRSLNHPVLNGIGDTDLLMNSEDTLLCTLVNKDTHTCVCSYVPIIPAKHPEAAWSNELITKFSSVTAGVYGKGRVVYFANQMDRLCYTLGLDDFSHLFHNAIRWVKRSEFSVETDAPPSVRAVLTQNKDDSSQYVLSVVNLTSSPNRPIRKLVPVSEFVVEICVPGRELESHTLLKQEADIKVTDISQRNDLLYVRVHFSRLDEFSSVYFRIRN